MPVKTQNKLPLFGIVFGLIGLAAVFAGFLFADKPVLQASDIQTCGECHDELVKGFPSTSHSLISEPACTSCHIRPEKHLEEPGEASIFAFRPTDMPNEKSKVCLSCHSRTSPRFLASQHGKGSLDCTTCHSIHSGNHSASLLKMNPVKSCYSCHEDIYAQFKLNERHRLQEGILSCSDCHNPHEPALGERLGGFKHESCLKCHTDKGGPYLYEHSASRVEGCTACHEVHGSPNRHLLTHQSISDLCFSCHAFAPSWHSRFTSQTGNCTSCHSTIHGSNLSKIFLK